MSNLSKEQSAALVAALENGGTWGDRFSVPKDLVDAGLITPCGDDLFGPWELTDAGCIVAQLCKDSLQHKDKLDELRSLDREMSQTIGSLLVRLKEQRDQQPYWRPIAQCGELVEGDDYLTFSDGIPQVSRTRGGRWFVLDWTYVVNCTHIEYLGPNPITVPAAPESEGS